MVGTFYARLFLVTALLLVLSSTRAQYPSQQGAVMVSASVQNSPASISLAWPSYPGATSYRIWKRAPGNTSWGNSIADVSGTAISYTDNTISLGTAYEYKIRRTGNGTGYGYVRSGIEVPAADMHFRGKIILLVESSLGTQLTSELAQLESDLIGDGWYPVRIDVNANDSPPAVRSQVATLYNSDPNNFKAVYIIGHVPVAYTGNIRPDGHNEHKGAWACDGYYGELNGNWTDNSVNTTQSTTAWNHNTPGDGKFDQNDFPSAVELMVGRVHLGELGAYAQTETQLVADYLNKAHNFKMKNWETPETAVMYDRLSWVNDPLASSGYASLAAMVGATNVNDVDVYNVPWDGFRSTPHLINYHSDSGTQSFENGTVIYTGMNISTIDSLVANPMGSVFHMTFGSYFGDWDNPNNYLRGLLASGNSLASVWSGQPNWYMHPMAMGEPIGECAKLAMNNTNANYSLQNGGWWGQGYARTHLGLMGDPTLRMKMVAPPTQLTASNSSWYIDLNWTASPDNVLGYYVYRVHDNTNTIELISFLITDTTFTSNSIQFVPGDRYMVRAAAITTSASGSFENLSLGAIAIASGTPIADCDGVVGGTNIAGTPCNDNDPLTANDTWDINCNCVGQVADCEGIIGCGAVPGSSCDDGDATTGADTYDANCNCAGLLIDCADVAGGSSLPGTACDDNDGNTGNDVYQSDCSCAGELVDCLGVIGGTDLPGTSCNDNDATTGNDLYDVNCNCTGQLIDCLGNPGGSALPGSPCNDGDATTGNDQYDSSCNCVGLPLDCQGDPGGTALPGSACNDNNAATGNDVWDANCNCAGQLIDCTGAIGGTALPGTPCDDNDPSTGNDVYLSDCSCTGDLIDCLGVVGGSTLPGTPCDDNDPLTGDDTYDGTCTCVGLLIDCEGIAGGNALPSSACDDGDANTTGDVYDVNCNCAGELVDCLGVIGGMALPGTSCDDNDANTGNDVYQSDCTCAGELIDCFGVIGGPALPGASCDDGDATTGNDVYAMNCVCSGQLIDCEGNAGGTAFPGTNCNDNDSSTGNDVWDTNCNCIGELIDCLGVIGGTSLPGTTCDDGDPATGNDQYDVNCNCLGQLIDCLGTVGGAALPGSPCDDSNTSTGNDTYDSNCNCVGQVLDCEGVAGGSALPGSPCNDGDPSTINDVWDTNCTCSGTLADADGDGVLDMDDLDDDNDGIYDSEEGLRATQELQVVEILDPDGATTDFAIDLTAINVAIGMTVDLSDFTANGDLNNFFEYFDLNVNSGELNWTGLKTGQQCNGLQALNSNPSGSVTVIDIGAGIPGLNFSGTTSSGVDDLNGCANGVDLVFTVTSNVPTESNTDGDALPDHMDPDSDNDGCSDVLEAGFTDNDFDGQLDGTGYNADGTVAGAADGYTGTAPATTDPNDQSCPIDCNGIPGGPLMPGTACNDNDATTGNDVLQNDCTCVGALIDCLGVIGGNTLPGESCNDGDASTGNDIYQSDCTCAGQPIDCEGIPGGISLPGTSCNDNDPLTTNDTYDASCNCSGQASDCLGVINGGALPGTSCDDGDANTLNDVYQADCTCAGETPDCAGVLGGNALPGTACDDGQVNTLNDTYDGNCNCTGILCDPTNPNEDCDGDGVLNGADLDDDNDGLLDTEEVAFSNFMFTYTNTIPPNGASTNFTIDLSTYNVPIGTVVGLSDFFAAGNLNGNNEHFDLDFNNGELVYSELTTDEKCPDIDPVLNNPSGTVTAVNIGNGISGILVSASSSPGVNVISSCSEITLYFDVSATATTLTDTDGDGAPDRVDPDSDNDGCFDAAEAGFSDPDYDGMLGTSPVTVDANGLVISATDGYTGTLPDVTDPNALNCVQNLVLLSPKVFLEGPFDPNQLLMHDSLRAQDLVPLVEPYTQLGYVMDLNNTGQVDQSILDAAGENAIVDWVIIELRAANNPTQIESICTALLQRDGDVVSATDGVSPISIELPPDDYHVVIRHRNHLGCMTATPISLSPTISFVDFTHLNTATWGTAARLNINGSMVLWSGNSVHDNSLKYTGSDNDRDPILVAVGGSVPTSIVAVYAQEDVNMDGLIKYTGSDNDRDPILVNIGGGVPTAIRAEQVP